MPDHATSRGVPGPDQAERVRSRLRTASISLVAAVLIFGAKFVAYRLTGSAAILSDALESIVNIVAAGMAAFSVWYASQPADENHPYGHGKIEDFSAGFEGALIVLAAAGILWSAIPRFFAPQPIEQIGAGALFVGAATAANLLLGVFLVRTGRRLRSRAIEADGRHVLTDVVTSVGALLALVLVETTGRIWIDPLVACLLAGQILVSGWGLIRASIGRLMDEADEAALDRVAAHLNRHRRDEWIDVHELRAWWSGDLLHVDVHLVLPRYWSIERSHRDADALAETLVEGDGGRSSAVVHVDPCTDVWCPHCRVEACPVRAADHRERATWDRAHLVRQVVPS